MLSNLVFGFHKQLSFGAPGSEIFAKKAKNPLCHYFRNKNILYGLIKLKMGYVILMIFLFRDLEKKISPMHFFTSLVDRKFLNSP